MIKDTVTTERWRWIGGSDMPVIMGISPFKTRFQLLQEKARIVEPDFKGNEYTEYGNKLEPLIRDYVNETLHRNFAPDVLINGDFRFNFDGLDKEHNEILEIKTTSQIHEKLEDYKVYYLGHSNGAALGIINAWHFSEIYEKCRGRKRLLSGL